jgi:APA family basic amino acid/polyamine antiporter
MATEKRFFKKAAVLDSKTFAPKNALWIQAFWIMILLFSGSFDLLTETLVFVNWCFYVLIGIGVFVARKKAHKLEKPAFKVPFYPWIPLIFTLFCLVYTGLSLYNDVTSFIERKTLFLNTITGLLLVFSGAPFYFYFKKNYKD